MKLTANYWIRYRYPTEEEKKDIKKNPGVGLGILVTVSMEGSAEGVEEIRRRIKDNTFAPGRTRDIIEA